jgi:hypothetical protein
MITVIRTVWFVLGFFAIGVSFSGQEVALGDTALEKFDLDAAIGA